MVLEEALILRRFFKSQTTFEESVELFNAILFAPEGDVVEVGSASGGTTIVLIGAAEQKGKMVYSIDPYPEEYEGKALHYTPGIMKELKEEFKKNILEGSWRNVIQFNETVEECIDKIPEGLSVVFIDSCHELSILQKEIKLLYPKLAVGGLMYVHDVYSEVGQLSQTKETGLAQIYSLFLYNKDVFLFANVKTIEFLSGRRILCIGKTRL